MASRLVFENKLPYRDFFFTQMPLMPYLYGLWMQIAGHSWVSARVFSAILTALLGTTVFAYVSVKTTRRLAGLVAVFLFVSSTLVFGWFTIAKTFASSGLFLMTAFVLLRSNASATAVMISGLCLGLAADVRLYVAGVVPLFLWWIYQEGGGTRLRDGVVFLAGFAIGVTPNVIFLLSDPSAYLFDNLLFHSIRSDSGIVGNFPQKLYVLAQLCFTGGAGNGLQMTLLIIVLVWLCVRRQMKGMASRRALQLAVLLGVISLLPTPSYIQYFSICVPFLIIAAVCSVTSVLQRMQSSGSKRLAAAGAVVFAALYASASIGDVRRFTQTGEGLNGIRDPVLASNWKIDSVRDVSRAVNQLAAPGEAVMSLWPGYIFESEAVPFPGLENNTGRERVDALKPGDAARYHILPQDQIELEIARHAPGVVVIGNQESMFIEAAPYVEMLIRSEYSIVCTIGGASIWLAPR
jgi:hypothetical protein